MSKNSQWQVYNDSDQEESLDESYDPVESEEDEDIPNESRYWRYEKAAPFSPKFASPELRRLRKERDGVRPNQSRVPPSVLFSPTPPVRIVLDRPFIDADTLQQVIQRTYRPSKKSQTESSATVEPKVLDYDDSTSQNKKKRKTASPESSPEMSPVKPKRRMEKDSYSHKPNQTHYERSAKPTSTSPAEIQSSKSSKASTVKSTNSAQKDSNAENMDVKERIARLKSAAYRALDASRPSENRSKTSRV